MAARDRAADHQPAAHGASGCGRQSLAHADMQTGPASDAARVADPRRHRSPRRSVCRADLDADLRVQRDPHRQLLGAAARRWRRQPAGEPCVLAAQLQRTADPGAAMNDARRQSAWLDANQKLLVADLARLKRRLACEADDAARFEADVAAAAETMSMPSAIDLIVAAFDLSRFERDLLMLCAGVELDAQFASACATARGAGGVTFALALAVLDEPHWSALAPAAPLRRWRLIDTEPGRALTTAPLHIDERILHFLAGINLLDARLQPLLDARSAPALMPTEQRALADKIAATWSRQPVPRSLIHLAGDDATGAEDVASTVAAQLGLQLLVLRAETLPAGAADLDSLITLWEREAALLPAALLVQC